MGLLIIDVKKMRYKLIFMILYLLCSCNSISFTKFDNANISYQIYVENDNILRLVRTNGFGAYTLQLFNNKGEICENETIATYSYDITKCNKDAVQLSAYVDRNDLKFFIHSVKINKANPDRIGRYNITYSYIIFDQTNTPISKDVDSASFNRKNKTVGLFLKGRLIATYLLQQLYVFPDSFGYRDNVKLEFTQYHAKNVHLIKNFLQSIISSSDAGERMQ